MRIGIHTGPVVVGEMGGGAKRELLALGETPNIAARIQGQAAPDEVVISTATYHLVEGLFECEDRGQPELKGVSIPLTLYRVVKEGEAQSRFEVVARKGLTPLIGRDHEFGLLCERWARVKEREGQVVLLSGEPGIGKSRLVEALKEQLGHEGVTRLEFRCSPYHQNSALYPIIDHLQRLLRFAREDMPITKLEKLQHTLSQYRFSQADTVPLLAALLSLPHPEDYPSITVSPQKQREKTQAALVAWVVEEAEKRPVYTTWEDLHWADPSTLEVLTRLLDQAPTTRLLAVGTFRPEFSPPWGNRSHLSQLTLSRLGRSQVAVMVERVTGGKTLPAEVLRQIVAKTDGVPLFVEELTKTVMESIESIGSIGSAIPATLQDSLMARLDRLGPAKEIAQVGATIGREFNHELLRAVSPLDEQALQQGLQQLVEAELVYQSGVLPQARYLFKHALIQDTAYQSLLKSRRQQLHQQVAQVLMKQFSQIVETQPELIAHHFTEAGLTAQAIPYWHKAGQRAAQRSAYVEAVVHLTSGLELLKALPDTPDRAQQELTLQVTLGASLIASKGYTALEVEKTYARARELCQQIGETSQLFPVLVGLQRFYNTRGEYQTAYELGEQCLTLANHAQDPALLVEAHRALGTTLYFRGAFALARSHLERSVALHEPRQYSSPTFNVPLDPGVSCLSYTAWALWFLGYPDQALKRSREVIALAQRLSHPFSLSVALVFAALLHQLRQEWWATQERAKAGFILSTEQGFAPSLAWGLILRGWALSEQGQGQEGIEQIHQGIATWHATGAGYTHFLALLAAAYGKVGQEEEKLKILAEALAVVRKTGECFYEAELYRLKGELTLQKLSVVSSQLSVTDPRPLTPDPQGDAEACFLKAVEIARKQQAKSLELRATTSLARLWQQQGKQKEAHLMLAGIYNWFTEGFDTKDLQEAQALLGELG